MVVINMSNQNIEERKRMKFQISKFKSLISTMDKIISNSKDIGFNYTSCNIFAKTYQDLVDESMKLIKAPVEYYTYKLDKLKNVFDMTGVEQKMLFESVYCSAQMFLNTLINYFDFAEDETDNLENLIRKRFRPMFRNYPQNEKEVQDKLEDLFIANNYNKGIDYDRETGKFNFSGREYIPDFIIPQYRLCIEVKLIKDTSRRSKIIEEINADITAYSKQYERVMFIVYDLGTIRDELEFKRDIESIGNNKVLIIKH